MKVWQDKKSSVAAETTTLPTDLSPAHTGLSLHWMLLSRACVRFARLRQDNKSSAAVMSPQPFQPQPSANNFWGTLPSAIRILSSVVTRRTRSGDILGAGQCIPVDVALKSLTIWPAYQHYEENNRGSIEVGKLADFVVLDKNPHKVPILALANLKVMETIKEGKTIYSAE